MQSNRNFKYDFDLRGLHIPLLKFMHIQILKLLLLARRLLRGVLRLSRYFLDLWFVIVLVALFIALIHLVNKQLFPDTKIATTIWDMKSIVFTSIIVTYASVTNTNERARRQKLHSQMDYYEEALAKFENFAAKFTYPFINKIEKPYLLFERLDYYRSQLVNAKLINGISPEYIARMAYRLPSDIDYVSHLETTIRSLSLESIESGNIYYASTQIREDIRLLGIVLPTIPDESSIKVFGELVGKIIGNMEIVLDQLRSPWRKDFRLEQKIREIMYSENKKASPYLTQYLCADLPNATISYSKE